MWIIFLDNLGYLEAFCGYLGSRKMLLQKHFNELMRFVSCFLMSKSKNYPVLIHKVIHILTL